MTTDTAAILSRLDSIQHDLAILKERLIDDDLVLTEEDRQAIREANADFDAGRTKRLA